MPVRNRNVFFLVALISCADHQPTGEAHQTDSFITEKIARAQPGPPPPPPPDSLKRIGVDDYPFTIDMFGRDSNAWRKTSGDVVSLDKVWFTNEELQQTIMVELYTDYFRTAVFHFQNHDIPKGLIRRMELHQESGDTATQEQKEKSFRGFIRTAAPAPRKYFASRGGLRLGISREQAIGIYGKPDKVTREEGTEVLEWEFEGDNAYEGKSAATRKPIARDSYGHQVTLFFKNNRLVALIFHNDIP